MTDPDAGAAVERTELSRRRTALPFLVVALLGARVALDRAAPGLLLAVVACSGAVALRWSRAVTPAVLLVAVAAVVVPEP